jgi:hypothetical protein
MRTQCVAVVVALSVAAAAPAWSHHSVAGEFDPNKPVVVTGTVTKIEWVNPHSRVRFDVVDASGNTTSWSVELAARVVLERMGWNGRSLKIGDKITVKGDQARSGAPMLNARGRELEALRTGAPKEYPITLGDGTPILFDR